MWIRIQFTAHFSYLPKEICDWHEAVLATHHTIFPKLAILPGLILFCCCHSLTERINEKERYICEIALIISKPCRNRIILPCCSINKYKRCHILIFWPLIELFTLHYVLQSIGIDQAPLLLNLMTYKFEIHISSKHFDNAVEGLQGDSWQSEREKLLNIKQEQKIVL